MYTASSRLGRLERHCADAIENFYCNHGELHFWIRAAGAVDGVYRRLRVLLRAKTTEVPEIGTPHVRMVR